MPIASIRGKDSTAAIGATARKEGNLKARALTTRVLLAVLPLLVGYGCTDKPNSPAVTPQAEGQGIATTAAVPAGGGVPKVAASPGSIKISGSQSGTVKMPVQQGGYLIKYRYKGNGLKLEMDSALGALDMIPGGQSAGSDGWTEFDDLTSFRDTGEQQYRITATDPFEIQFVKLPIQDAPDIPPKSYNGNGLRIIGPFSLKAGSASFKVTCPDLKRAGFVAELYDGATAQTQGMIALGTGASVAETKKLPVPSAGNYLVKVNANGKSEWAMEISQ